MMKSFDLKNIQQSPATFDMDKLLWVNQQHMKNTSGENIKNILMDHFKAKKIKVSAQPNAADLYEALKDRCKTLDDICTASELFYNDVTQYDTKSARKQFSHETAHILKELKMKLTSITHWNAENILAEIKLTANNLNLKMGQVAPPLRLAVTGGAESPSIDLTLELLGPEKTLSRIDQAIEYIATSG